MLRGTPSKYGIRIHSISGTVITACASTSTACVPIRWISVNMMNQGSTNSVPGAMRVNSVTLAGHVTRCQDTANAAGTASTSPNAVEPPATMMLLARS